MKILMTNYTEVTSPGGVHKTIVELAGNLVKRGHEVTVLQGNPMSLPEREICNGFEIIRIKSNFSDHFYGFSPEIYFFLKKNFQDLNPDIVHVHGYHTLLSPLILYSIKKMNSEVPIFFTPHYDPLNRSNLAGKLFGGIYNFLFGEKFFKMTDYVISISNFEANNIKKIYDAKITVIPNGIDFINIKKKCKDDTIKLLYAGYLLDYKGVQHIIKTVHQLVKIEKVNNVNLTIVGEGDYKNSLLKLTIRLGVENFIVWKPFLSHDKILEEMKKSDIFLLLSKSEGYGIVVAEALSMGTPVIITKRTALEEFLTEPGCFGVDCPPDPTEVADSIKNIYDCDLKVGPFTNKIKTWDKVAEAYENVYLNYLNL